MSITNIAPVRQAHPMTESELKAVIVKRAHELGWLVFSMPQASRHPRSVKSASGYPDLTLARDGEHLWIECKAPDGALSSKQWAWVRAIGNGYHVIFPDMLDRVEELLA